MVEMDLTVPKDQKAKKAIRAEARRQALRAIRVKRAIKALLVKMERMGLEVRLVVRDQRDRRVYRASRGFKALKAPRAKTGSQEEPSSIMTLVPSTYRPPNKGESLTTTSSITRTASPK